MKKKLISMIAILAIVTGSVFADQDQEVSNSTTPITEYSENAYSLDTTSDSSTVVADAESEEFVYTLEAQNGTGWVSAEGEEVFDSSWDVRDGFNVDFRIRATAGTINAVSPVEATISVGKLTHTELNSTIIDKDITISDAAAGDYLTLGTTSGGSNADYVIPFETISGHYYGIAANAAGDSVSFNIAYAGDSEAPAGRYESDVTVAYAAN